MAHGDSGFSVVRGADERSAGRVSAVMPTPTLLITFCDVWLRTLVIDAGVVALLLAFRGAAALPVFVGYFVLSGAVFLFLFQPLLVAASRVVPAGSLGASLPILVSGLGLRIGPRPATGRILKAATPRFAFSWRSRSEKVRGYRCDSQGKLRLVQACPEHLRLGEL